MMKQMMKEKISGEDSIWTQGVQLALVAECKVIMRDLVLFSILRKVMKTLKLKQSSCLESDQKEAS